MAAFGKKQGPAPAKAHTPMHRTGGSHAKTGNDAGAPNKRATSTGKGVPNSKKGFGK